AVYKDNLSLTLTAVPNGMYDVYLYVWENDWPEIYSVYLKGQPVISSYNSIGAGYWAKLGPWTTTVADGKIDITSTGWFSNLSGIEVWQHISPTPPPQVTATTVPSIAASPTSAPSATIESSLAAASVPAVPLQII